MNTNCKFNEEIEVLNKFMFKRIIFNVLILITIIQQMPIIKDIFYDKIRLFLYISFGLISFISFLNINKFFKIKFIKYYIFTLLYSLILFIINNTFSNISFNIFELTIPFGILISSMNINYSRRQLSNLLFWYILLSAILGISSIFYYGQGFSITRNYFLTAKNQIGPILGIATIILGIWILDEKQFDIKFNRLIFKLILLFMLLASILTIRNRSGLLGIFIVLIIMLTKEYKFKRNIRNILILFSVFFALFILTLLGVLDGVADYIYKSIFLNYNISDLNSVSAGRIYGYKLAFRFLMDYPILGQLETGEILQFTPHNYILNKWVKFGVIGSLPFILFYLYLYIFTIKSIYKSNNRIKFSLYLWVLLFSLIVSIFEYTYPYGPGVSQVMTWFLLGQFFNNTQNNYFI